MLTDPLPEQSQSPLKNPLLYSSSVLLVALLATAFVMFSRWQDARNIERQAAQHRAKQQHEQDRATVEQLGGKDLAILSFYASPRAIHRGESAQLCYGVSNAKSIKLEPTDHAVWPSYSNCVNVSPAKSITYTLTIEDASGKKVSESVEVQVR